MPITSMLDAIHVKIMDMMTRRRDKCNKWKSLMCLKMEKRLVKRIQLGRTWKVTKSADDVFEVHSDNIFCVDLKRFFCSCNVWTIESFPCEHALQCILSIGEDVHKFCDPYLVVSAFRDSYSHSINPVPDIEKPKGKPEGSFILPPDTKRTPGRRRNKRKESMGARERKLRKCSRCNLYGYHNRATCTAGC
ncbi:hypothetical protein IFM89_032166 [Coptis chinensis]|uniref:SWIM-type domain-containing protein n=1 Tax=Coptis chinensis TaxID=261450 RepID=A0A835ME33_9MAGN|nr:hypothetical protein IFM89_032166 [Coptis chinensis]